MQVSDKSLAAVFYGEGLGLTADPGSTAAQRGGVGVTWYNIGRQQVSKPANHLQPAFDLSRRVACLRGCNAMPLMCTLFWAHILCCSANNKGVLQFHIAGGSEAQRTPLPVKLVLPDHASLLERLELVKATLENTEFRFEQRGDLVAVTDPFGQHFEVHQPSKDDVFERGIKDILLPCAPGTAAAIGAFYEKFYKVSFLKPIPGKDKMPSVLVATFLAALTRNLHEVQVQGSVGFPVSKVGCFHCPLLMLLVSACWLHVQAWIV